MPRISYIVSAYDRPKSLRGCLDSLLVQTDQDFEVYVMDNATVQEIHVEQEEYVQSLKDDRFHYVHTGAMNIGDCYWTGDYAVANLVTGEFVCFPSDDSYYVPKFGERMYRAAVQNHWDLVYCKMLYDDRLPDNRGEYDILDVLPVVCRIDKTGFIVRRSKFIPFPGKNPADVTAPCCADGWLVQALVKSGIRHGKVRGVYVVHN